MNLGRNETTLKPLIKVQNILIIFQHFSSQDALITVPCKKTGLLWVFHTKYIHTTRVENHLKVMLNPPFFSQLLALMWKGSP